MSCSKRHEISNYSGEREREREEKREREREEKRERERENLLSACRRILIKYAPALSEVVYRPLDVAVGALEKAHIYTLCTLEK